MIFAYIGVKCASETAFALGLALDTPTSPPVTFGLFNLITGPYSSFGRKRTLRAYKGLGTRLDCHGTVRVVFASVAMGMGIDLHGVDTIIQAVLKTISKLVVEVGEVEIKWGKMCLRDCFALGLA